jgi:hypothetical protein
LTCSNHAVRQATSAVISPLQAQHYLTRLCLITLRSTLDPILLRTALHLRCQSAVGKARTMASASRHGLPYRALARDSPETALHVASRRPTTQPSAASLTWAVMWTREVLQGVVNHPRVNGMQGVRGSNPLSSTPGQRPSRPSAARESPASGSKSAAICSCQADPVVRPGRTRPGAVSVVARSTRGPSGRRRVGRALRGPDRPGAVSVDHRLAR